MAEYPAVLRGGPFNGDSGTLAVEPPERLFVFRCRAKCQQIHWSDQAPHGDYDIYVHLHEEAGIEIYVWLDLAGSIDDWLADVTQVDYAYAVPGAA